MIVFFALLGISCKRKIPEAHTLLEIVRIRYGTIAHIVWIVLCLINNLIAVANMLLGASAVITAMYDSILALVDLSDKLQDRRSYHRRDLLTASWCCIVLLVKVLITSPISLMKVQIHFCRWNQGDFLDRLHAYLHDPYRSVLFLGQGLHYT